MNRPLRAPTDFRCIPALEDVSEPSGASPRGLVVLGKAIIRRRVCRASTRRYGINANRRRHSLQNETQARRVPGLTTPQTCGKSAKLRTQVNESSLFVTSNDSRRTNTETGQLPH